MFHHSCCESCCDTGCCGDTGCANGSCGGAPAVTIDGGAKPNNYEKMPDKKADTKVEPPLKPAGLESAPAVVPNVSVETEKSPF
jgi:hypothetical protein